MNKNNPMKTEKDNKELWDKYKTNSHSRFKTLPIITWIENGLKTPRGKDCEIGVDKSKTRQLKKKIQTLNLKT